MDWRDDTTLAFGYNPFIFTSHAERPTAAPSEKSQRWPILVLLHSLLSSLDKRGTLMLTGTSFKPQLRPWQTRCERRTVRAFFFHVVYLLNHRRRYSDGIG
jgi:hypothetical protein